MGKGGPNRAPKAPTAPATVSGERLSNSHWSLGFGKAESTQRPASQETGQAQRQRKAVGCDGKENDMNTTHRSDAKTSTGLLSVLFVALIGATMLFVAGHAQSATLHDAAHDMRHATGFPCH
jgi:cobalt transporter subunit CbtB